MESTLRWFENIKIDLYKYNHKYCGPYIYINEMDIHMY